ncbi:MAG: DUF6883 domain-containing protein [Planctomycetota bacterium]
MRADITALVKLPGADQSHVEPRKVRDYLLSPTHPFGRYKAVFFGALGYLRERWPLLLASLVQHAAEGTARRGELTTFGQKYEVRGRITGPSGRAVNIVSVWIVRAGEETPRFVTAFPANKP